MKKILTVCALLFAVVTLASAKSKFIDVPGKNEVTIVVRINFTSDADREWLFKAFEVPEDKRNYPDVYIMPYFSENAKLAPEDGKRGTVTVDKAKLIGEFEEQAWGVNGGYVFAQYNLNKNRTVYLSAVQLFIGGSYMLPVLLPLNLKVQVPKDEKFLYLGDFTFSAKGFAFDVTGTVRDEYEAAQVALNGVTKKEYKLARANAEKVSEEEMGRVFFAYQSAGLRFSKWYYQFKDLISEKD